MNISAQLDNNEKVFQLSCAEKAKLTIQLDYGVEITILVVLDSENEKAGICGMLRNFGETEELFAKEIGILVPGRFLP